MIRPAKYFSPGEYLWDEYVARGETLDMLAEKSGIDSIILMRIMLGEHQITQEIADGLAKAYGGNAETWMNLEKSYQERFNS